MKNLIYTFAIVTFGLLVAVGCGKKRSNNACGYGQVHNGYTCVNQYGYGYGGYGNGGWGGGYNAYSTEIVATFSASNQTVFGALLRDAGQCSRYSLYNFGSEKCSRYNNGGSIVLRTNGTSGSAMVELGSATNQLYSNPVYAGMIPQPYGNAYSAPASYAPMYISGQLVADGQWLRFTSYNGLEIWIEGTTLTGSVRMQLNYRGHAFATAVGRRRF